MEAKLTNVYNRTSEAFLNKDNLIINQGGQGSSKTFSILQLLYQLAKYQKKGRRITIASYALPHLKAGAMLDFEKIVESFGDNPFAYKNKTESTYEINNSVIEFLGIEGNIAKAHGPRRDILFINECNRKITYEVFDQLNSRTQECTFLDYNPDQEFWLHEKVIPNFKYVFIKSNYLDNPWLPVQEVSNILMKKDKPGFENWWKVYGLGELGKLEDAILPNWRYGEFDSSLPFGFGCDFGFNDPDVLIKVAIDMKSKKIYCDEKIYKSGNSADQFRQMIAMYADRNNQIIADCADARMINELKRYFNIKPVDKVKWTVAEALKMMQDYEIIVTETSTNIAKEINNYVWSDRQTGVPMKGFDHTIDSIRYYFQHTISKGIRTQTWHPANG